MFKRGGIYAVNFAPKGAKAPETCPCLVVSNNVSNEFSPVVTILPLTYRRPGKTYEFETRLPADKTGLPQDATTSSHILITIDKTKVVGERLGFLNKALMQQVEKSLRFQLDL